MNKEEKNKKLQGFRDKTVDVCPVVGYKSGRHYLVCKEKSGCLIIKESFKNRLKNSFILFLLGPGIALMAWYKWEEFQRNPLIIKVLMGLMVFIGCIFALRYLMRLFKCSYIEINPQKDIVVVRDLVRKQTLEVKRREIHGTNIKTSFFYITTDGISREEKTYTLEMERTMVEGELATIQLCSSMNLAEIESVSALVQKYLSA